MKVLEMNETNCLEKLKEQVHCARQGSSVVIMVNFTELVLVNILITRQSLYLSNSYP